MTANEYRYVTQAITNELANVRSALLNLGTSRECQLLSGAIGDAMNRLHDAIYDLEREREDVEREWCRRDWTTEDHNSAALAFDNID
jgi:hypothetical protein